MVIMTRQQRKHAIHQVTDGGPIIICIFYDNLNITSASASLLLEYYLFLGDGLYVIRDPPASTG